MKKTEMFDMLLAKVADECEVSVADIINGSKVQSVVDARVIAVQYLRRIGLSNDDIAEIVLNKLNAKKPTIDEIKRKAKGVDKMFCSYSNRCIQSYAFCLMSKAIKEFCRETYSDLYIYGMKELSN